MRRPRPLRRALLLAVLALAPLAARRPAALADPAAPAPAGATVLDAQSGISETTWPNGLRLLVKPLPDDPMCACMIWYSVGSRDEDVGETGLSHYLEHMMFKGTKKLQKGAIDRLTQRNGGSNNASTRYDATEYHFSFPADRWQVALEIEADRMRGSDVLPAEFDAEKNVVLQELHHGLDDPADVLDEAMMSAAFPVTGYHHPVIGWPEDVETTTRDRMMRYYLKHYTPDRATIVVVGGVDRDAVIARTGELFAAIPRGDVVRHDAEEPPPRGETRITLRQDTQVPRLSMAWRSLSIRDPKEPALDLLVEILSGDKTTRLDKRLVDGGIAANVAAWSDTRRDGGLFQVQVEPTEGRTLDECEKAVNDVLRELAEAGPTPEEVARAKAKILAARVFAQESSMGVAESLGSLAVVTDWRYYLRYPDAISAVTADDLRALAKRVFQPSLALVGRSLPKDRAPAEPAGSSPPSPGAAPSGGGAPSNGGGRAGGDRSPRRSDRTAPKGRHGARCRGEERPAAGALDRALDLTPVREVLENGLTVLLLRRGQAPIVTVELAVRDGRLGEAVPGLDALAGSLLEEGTTARSGEEVAAAIGSVGGSLSAGGGGVTVRALSKDAKLALELALEVASKPAFAADALERVRAQQLQAIESERDTPSSVAGLRFAATVYGEGHPLGRSSLGTPESVAAITREQVVAHHARFFVPRNATLAVVSDLDPAAVLPLVRAAFGGWAGGDKPTLALPELRAPKAETVRLETDKTQTNVYLGHLGVRRSDPDYEALQVMDNVFGTGSGFTDRLSRNIRDEKGLAYTVYGNVTSSAGVLPGTFTVYAATRPQDAEKAMAEMRREIAGILSTPPTEEELEGAKAALRGGMLSSLETGAQAADMLLSIERFGLGFDYPRRHLAAVLAVTAEDVVRVAKAHLHPETLVEVVVAGKPAAGEAGEPK